ncbi:MAG: histone deacetylase [Pseudomonadota bacterium]
MQVFYSPDFNLDLPDGHRFPGGKYALLKNRLLTDGVLQKAELFVSPQASRDDLLHAHDAAYIDAIETGDVDRGVMRRIGFPWSPALARRSRVSVGGALAAADAALDEGIAGQLAGGTHHAHRAFGAGYCVFNDHAVVALKALALGRARRVAVIDLDVHQGDGNAAILGERDDVFVVSLHGEKNFPFRKQTSHLDIGLPDGTGDADYLAVLRDALPEVFAFAPDLVLYQAGVDPLKEDKLGRLELTYNGLMARDRLVLSACRRRGIPVSMAIGGGYADPIEASVEAYANTYRVAKEVYGV